MTGTCVSWGPGSYGWVWCRLDRTKYFAHAHDLVDVLTLTPGQRVEFEPVATDKGPRAVDVHPL